MSVPSSMVHRSGKGLVVRSLVSGDALFETSSAGGDADDDFDAKELPDCKVKRNYTCSSCDFFTQNPRVYLYHLRDVHNEKVKVSVDGVILIVRTEFLVESCCKSGIVDQ